MQTNLIRLAEVFGGIRDPNKVRICRCPPCSPSFFSVSLPGKIISLISNAGQKIIGKHFKTPLGFKRNCPPVATTLSRNLANISLQELQDAFMKFLSQLLENQELTAAVDGKTAKQIKDADGEPLPMLNVFVHDIKVTLAAWSVKGDKTNEPGCLKQHPGELLQKYPQLKIVCI